LVDKKRATLRSHVVSFSFYARVEIPKCTCHQLYPRGCYLVVGLSHCAVGRGTGERETFAADEFDKRYRSGERTQNEQRFKVLLGQAPPLACFRARSRRNHQFIRTMTRASGFPRFHTPPAARSSPQPADHNSNLACRTAGAKAGARVARARLAFV